MWNRNHFVKSIVRFKSESLHLVHRLADKRSKMFFLVTVAPDGDHFAAKITVQPQDIP